MRIKYFSTRDLTRILRIIMRNSGYFSMEYEVNNGFKILLIYQCGLCNKIISDNNIGRLYSNIKLHYTLKHQEQVSNIIGDEDA